MELTVGGFGCLARVGDGCDEIGWVGHSAGGCCYWIIYQQQELDVSVELRGCTMLFIVIECIGHGHGRSTARFLRGTRFGAYLST